MSKDSSYVAPIFLDLKKSFLVVYCFQGARCVTFVSSVALFADVGDL